MTTVWEREKVFAKGKGNKKVILECLIRGDRQWKIILLYFNSISIFVQVPDELCVSPVEWSISWFQWVCHSVTVLQKQLGKLMSISMKIIKCGRSNIRKERKTSRELTLSLNRYVLLYLIWIFNYKGLCQFVILRY